MCCQSHPSMHSQKMRGAALSGPEAPVHMAGRSRTAKDASTATVWSSVSAVAGVRSHSLHNRTECLTCATAGRKAWSPPDVTAEQPPVMDSHIHMMILKLSYWKTCVINIVSNPYVDTKANSWFWLVSAFLGWHRQCAGHTHHPHPHPAGCALEG